MNINEQFINSCAAGDKNKVKKIIKSDDAAMPTITFSLGLQEACRKGHEDIAKMLLDDGRADPTAYGSEAIQMAYEYGNEGAVKLLLDDGRSDPSKLKRFELRD